MPSETKIEKAERRLQEAEANVERHEERLAELEKGGNPAATEAGHSILRGFRDMARVMKLRLSELRHRRDGTRR
ncbi:hypothetical protein GCM10011390_33370 [Aureimonas endophytica]|uniref:Uncharacterized protein n=1 Tax=Aureimonas endophytica TaxID=2027858 RepID=A0A916ZSA2_9HYPH|nr:hypothetical protein [Aureimonas endophytica]GGE11568.1 hypothetical protein GCM10011390_33370 [Aureimonas endophytica]